MGGFSIIVIFVLGAAIGSFLNVVIYRIPEGKSIVTPASHCPHCHTPIKWYHNIPILSWIILGGKCAYCKASIALQYPLVELITALIFVLLYLKLGPVWHLPFVWASFSALLALALIDFKYYAIPDSVNFFALVTALIQPDLLHAALYALIAAAGLFILGKGVGYLFKKEALGSADVIVAGTMAALLGFPDFFLALFIAALLALLPALFARDAIIPFVPFLALATWIVYIYSEQSETLLNGLIYG